jgi:hypothetical protein
MRVAFVLRSAEVQPLFQDLCEQTDTMLCNVNVSLANSPPSFYLSPRVRHCAHKQHKPPLCAWRTLMYDVHKRDAFLEPPGYQVYIIYLTINQARDKRRSFVKPFFFYD